MLDSGRAPAAPKDRLAPRRGCRLVAALLAALSFGTAFLLVDAGAAGGGPLWTSAGQQAGGLLALAPVIFARPLRRLLVARYAYSRRRLSAACAGSAND